MSAVENKKLVQDAFAAWARGDGTAFFNLLADDVQWTVIGSSPVSRTYPSKHRQSGWLANRVRMDRTSELFHRHFSRR